MCSVIHAMLHAECTLRNARKRQKGIKTADDGSKVHVENHTNGTSNLDNSDIRRERIMEIFFPIKSPIFRPSENEKWIFRQYTSITIENAIRDASRTMLLRSDVCVCVWPECENGVCVKTSWRKERIENVELNKGTIKLTEQLNDCKVHAMRNTPFHNQSRFDMFTYYV